MKVWNRFSEGIIEMENLDDLATVLDTDGSNRKFVVADLIYDRVTYALRSDSDLAGELQEVRCPDDETVIFNFADGRTITARVEISPR